MEYVSSLSQRYKADDDGGTQLSSRTSYKALVTTNIVQCLLDGRETEGVDPIVVQVEEEEEVISEILEAETFLQKSQNLLKQTKENLAKLKQDQSIMTLNDQIKILLSLHLGR